MTTDRIDFVNENNRGTMRFGLIEQIAYSTGANANEHLDKVRTRNVEERNACFSGYGARQQRFTSSRIAQQQHAAWNLGAQRLELFGVFQKVDGLPAIPAWLLQRRRHRRK